MIALYNLEPKYTNIALEKIRMFYENQGEAVVDYLSYISLTILIFPSFSGTTQNLHFLIHPLVVNPILIFGLHLCISMGNFVVRSKPVPPHIIFPITSIFDVSLNIELQYILA